MTDTFRLSDAEIQEQLTDLNDTAVVKWQLVDGKLHKQFKFKNFITAMAFMQAGGVKAEAMNHHPEWCNVYNRVTIDLITHSMNGISALDFTLATEFEQLS